MIGVGRRVPKGILKRSFEAPRESENYVVRAALDARFDLDEHWRFCFVGAPAGYGKTALLSHWHNRSEKRAGTRALWMTLSEEDRDASHFSCGIAFLLGGVDDRFYALSLELESGDDARSSLVRVLNLADEVLDPDVTYVVFFDGYDSAESDALDSALLFLLRYSSSSIRFVVSGTHFSPRVRDLELLVPVIEFSAADLALDDDVSRKLALSLMPDLSEEAYCDIIDRFGQWPMAFIIVALARRRSGAANAFAEARRVFGRFFMRELLDRVDSTVYSFLVETALLDWIEPSLADRITGGRFSRSILDYLVSDNLFFSYDRIHDTFVRNPALTDFLRSKFLAFKRVQISRLAGFASEWFEERNLYCDQAKYTSIMCDPSYVIGMVEGSTGLSVEVSEDHFTEHLIEQPADRFLTDRLLAWVAVWSFISTGNASEARRWLGIACAADGTTNGISEPSHAYRYAEAICTPLEGDSKTSLSIIESLLRDAGADMPRAFQCLLVHMQGEDCERLGRLREARDLYLKALAMAERTDSTFYRLFDYYLLAQHYAALGSFEDALSMVHRGLDVCDKDGVVYGALNAVLAYVQIERHELDEAEASVRRAVGHVSRLSNTDMYVEANIALARLRYVKGETREALRIASDIVDGIAGRAVPRNMAMRAHALLADLACRLGETSVVRREGDTLETFLDSPDSLRVVPCLISKARVSWSCGDQDGALATLSRAKEQCRQSENPFYLAKTLVIEAEFLYQLDRCLAASASLERAVELSMRGGYRSVFTEGDEGVRKLLLDIAAGRKGLFATRRYARELLALFQDEDEVRSALAQREGDVKGYYALTEREREILHWMNSGMSRRELAETLGVSQNTVKTHLKNIYSKLGVHTRTEAYEAAREAEGSKA